MSLNNPAFWTHIAENISEVTNIPFRIKNKQTVHGGCINQAFHIQDNEQNYFVKVNDRSSLDNFHSEVTALSAIQKTNSIKVPKIMGSGSFENFSFLILEYLHLKNRGSIRDFAIALASLHKNQSKMFGFHQNNYIGATKQINSSMHDWAEFFLQNRIGYQLELLESKYDIRALRNNEKLLKEKIEYLFKNHSPAPSLLHGDLWQGNYSFDRDGTPVIFDPASYYGDHEAELAMLELFGSPGKAFFDTYQEYYPINKGYQQRKKLYNLYHILNHANLFGASYLAQANDMIEHLVTQ